MKTSKDKTVAFTGHRRLSGAATPESLREALRNTVLKLYNDGYRTFLSGMAEGFDMEAAEVVTELKKIIPDIRLVAVVPCGGQDKYFRPENKIRYQNLLDTADEVVILSDYYYNDCFLRRNDYLIANCGYVVCYYDGHPKGGTYYTVVRADRNGLKFTNLYP